MSITQMKCERKAKMKKWTMDDEIRRKKYGESIQCGLWIYAIYMRLFDSHWCFYRFLGNLMSVSFLIHFRISNGNGKRNEPTVARSFMFRYCIVSHRQMICE